jgi:flagellar export protein FliJ
VKRFKFSLQTVHDLRCSRKEEAERGLAQASADVADAEERLEKAKEARSAALEGYSKTLRSGVLDLREESLRMHYMTLLAQREEEDRKRLAALKHAREERRRALVDAARQAEVTESLRERHLANHRAETARAEQSLLDELATLASARRLNGAL